MPEWAVDTWTWGKTNAQLDVSCENTRMMMLIARAVWGVSSEAIDGLIAEMDCVDAPYVRRPYLEDEKNFAPLWVFLHIAEGLQRLCAVQLADSRVFAPDYFAEFGLNSIRFQTWGNRRRLLQQLFAPLANPSLGYRAVPREDHDFNWTKAYRIVKESPGMWRPVFFVREGIPPERDIASDYWIVEGLWPGIATIFGLPPARVKRLTRGYDPVRFFTHGSQVRECHTEVAWKDGVLLLNGQPVGVREYALPSLLPLATYWNVGETTGVSNEGVKVRMVRLNRTDEVLRALCRTGHDGQEQYSPVAQFMRRSAAPTVHAADLSRMVAQEDIWRRHTHKYYAQGDSLLLETALGAQILLGSYEDGLVHANQLPPVTRFTRDVSLDGKHIIIAEGEVWGPALGFSAEVRWDSIGVAARFSSAWKRLFPNSRRLRQDLAYRALEARVANMTAHSAWLESERVRAEGTLEIRADTATDLAHEMAALRQQSFSRYAARFPNEEMAQAVLDGTFEKRVYRDCVTLVIDCAGSTAAIQERVQRQGAAHGSEEEAAVYAGAYGGFMTWAARVAEENGGWVFGYEGDAIKVIFGLDARDRHVVAEGALACAVALLGGISAWPPGEGKKFGARVGLATDTMRLSLVGEGENVFLSPNSSGVNRAAHLEKNMCARAGGEIAMDTNTAKLLTGLLSDLRFVVSVCDEVLDGQAIAITRVRLK